MLTYLIFVKILIVLIGDMEKIYLQNNNIVFYLIRKKVKNIILKIKADGNIIVSANKTVPLDFIKAFIAKKRKWIEKNLVKVEKAKENQINRQYINGEFFYYLGNKYILKIENALKEKVEIIGNYLFVFVKDIENTKKIISLINKWYSNEIQKVFTKIFFQTCKKFKNNFNDKYILKFRSMKSRWGSCYHKKGVIILNSKLIFAPEICIEYVILHELCHFKIQNHSKSFYNLLSGLMPDYKKRKQTLNEENYISYSY